MTIIISADATNSVQSLDWFPHRDLSRSYLRDQVLQTRPR